MITQISRTVFAFMQFSIAASNDVFLTMSIPTLMFHKQRTIAICVYDSLQQLLAPIWLLHDVPDACLKRLNGCPNVTLLGNQDTGPPGTRQAQPVLLCRIVQRVLFCMKHQAATGLRLFRVEQRLQRWEGVSPQARGFDQLFDRLAKLRILTHDRHQHNWGTPRSFLQFHFYRPSKPRTLDRLRW